MTNTTKLILAILLILYIPILTSCDTILSTQIPTPTITPTPIPTPTPTPDPCTMQAMHQIASDIKILTELYIQNSENNESVIHLLPKLLELRDDVKHIVDIPICVERMKTALNTYTNINSDQLQTLLIKLTNNDIITSIQSARSWLETTLNN